jgi:hypothetical protein
MDFAYNQYGVYLMASYRRVLYVGVTNDLQRRVYQHKQKAHPESFTARYNVYKLVYFEQFGKLFLHLAPYGRQPLHTYGRRFSSPWLYPAGDFLQHNQILEVLIIKQLV